MAKPRLTAISIIKQGGDRRGPGAWTIAYRPEGQMGYHLYKISDPTADAALDALLASVNLESLPEADCVYHAHDSREHAVVMELKHGAAGKAEEARVEAAQEREGKAWGRYLAAWGVEVAE